MEEEKPLAWQQRVIYNSIFCGKSSKNKKLEEQREVRADSMLVRQSCNVVHHKSRNQTCLRRRRKSEIVIVSITVLFMILLLSFVTVTLYVKIVKQKTGTGPIQNSTTTRHTMVTTTTSSVISRLPETSPTPTLELRHLNTTLQESPTTALTSPETHKTFRSATSESSHSSKLEKLNTNFPSTTEMPTVSQTSIITHVPLTGNPTAFMHFKKSTIPSNSRLSQISTRVTPISQFPTTIDGNSHLRISSSSACDLTVCVKTTNTLVLSETTQSDKTTSSDPLQNELMPQVADTSSISSIAFTEISNPRSTISAENRISSTRDEKSVKSSDLFFVEGPFTYEEARMACAREGSLLGLKKDIRRAWDAGYKRESYGWLRDLHIAMVKVEKNEEVTYEPPQNPDIRQTGAYCVTNSSKFDSRLVVGSNLSKTVNWWLTNDAADVYDLRHILMSITSEDDDTKYPLLASLKSIYTCCNAFNITYTAGESPIPYVKKRYSDAVYRKVIEIYHRELAPVKVLTHVSVKYKTMINYQAATTYRTQIISSLVTMVKDIGLDGIVIDYEPKKEYTREHATIYRTFLDELTDAMRKEDMLVGTVVSSWGILKHYDIIGGSKVDFIGSMSSTYYGHNIEKSKRHVLEMLKYISADRLKVGLGLMYKSSKVLTSRRNFRWNQKNLQNFVTWFAKEGVQSIHVYPGKWKSHLTTEKYFLEALKAFSES